MIARMWRGWTAGADSAAYERIVLGRVIPDIEARRVPGFRHIDLLRRTLGDGGSEFVTVMWFDDLDAVRRFAGEDHEASHVPEAARTALADFDARAAHYEVLDCRTQAPRPPDADRREPLPRNAALVVIDVQEGFEDPAWGPRNNPGAELNIARLIDAWRSGGRPVLHVHHRSCGPDGRFREGTPGSAVKAIAAPRAGEPVYVKRVNSAFIGTDLERDLRAAGIGTVALVGLTTNHCVSTTARMSGNLGFDTIVVADATAAFARRGSDGRTRSAEDVHVAALGDLDGEFATIMETAAVLTAVARPG